MNKKDKIIAVLILAAAALFAVILFVIVPANQRKQAEYALNQTDSLTHDYTVIEKYKSPYIGDVPNAAQLFYALPLNNIPMKFELDSDTCTLTVHYLDIVWNIGEDKVRRDLIYNTVAAMAAIDNLEAVVYEFSDERYLFKRDETEKIFDIPLSELLSENTWEKSFRNNLKSDKFVSDFFGNKQQN